MLITNIPNHSHGELYHCCVPGGEGGEERGAAGPGGEACRPHAPQEPLPTHRHQGTATRVTKKTYEIDLREEEI